MTTSGSIDFNLSAGEVIDEAFKVIGVKPAETPLEAFQYEDGRRALNMMLKGWQAQGLHLWTKTEGVLFLQQDVSEYSFPTVRATREDDFIGTTLTADILASATTIPIVSTGMAVNDQIGIELDDGTRFWTTIATIPDSSSVTIATGVTSASSSGKSVFTFTNLLERPLRIYDYARRQTFGQNSEIELNKFSRQDYFTQVNKVSSGTLAGFYYSRQRDTGLLYVWQPPSNNTQLLRFTFERNIEDIDQQVNTLDVPTEWMEAIVYNLAARLAISYTVNPNTTQIVEIKAQQYLEEMLGFDEENVDFKMEPWYQ